MSEIEKKIEELREQVDEIDEKVVGLLNERAQIALAIRKFKEEKGIPIYDPEREGEIYRKLSANNSGPLSDEAIREIYKKILHYMKDME
ncbi:MAG: chorismate mutase [Actinomycetota bacterium]|nr:chorismate mutase [Actinomycetota bacterium]